MNKFSYTYCPIKYVHDPAAGEMLNIGVLLFSSEKRQIIGKFDYHFERLSNTFANFNGNHYRFVMTSLDYSISKLNSQFEPSLFKKEPFKDIKEILTSLVPDLGLSVQFGTIMAGITNDLENEAEQIFQRLVVSQYPQKEKKSRTDEEIWTIFNKPLSKKRVSIYLKPKHFVSNEYDLKFNYTFKNDKTHILDPITMDYAQADFIQNKAIKVLGQAMTLQGNNEIGKLYLLLGEPKIASHRNAYIKAKNLLNKIPLEKEFVEERDAESFADELESEMKQHGIIK